MPRPRLLDLFCGQGGAGWGYHLAGFHVTGVDIRPMPLHPAEMEFVHADALEYLAEHGHEFDVIHASPPCRAYTRARGMYHGKYQHPELIAPVRELLLELGLPYVIENVEGAPLKNPAMLCGTMFGLRMYRHRLFESSVPLTSPPHGAHVHSVAKMGRQPVGEEFWNIAGNFSGVKAAGEAMGMPWGTQDGIRQAIPPAYTRHIGGIIKDASTRASIE